LQGKGTRMNVGNRLKRIEEKLRLSKESNVVPLVIVITKDESNDKADRVVRIGGPKNMDETERN
jgi:hypothetical protein